MKIACITPDRNDRPDFLEHCKWQMARQTIKPVEHIIINYPCTNGEVDIVPRIRTGLNQAIAKGCDACLIIENDDYYPDNYIETMLPLFEQAQLIGIYKTEYYSLEIPGIKAFDHSGRASLFCTGIRLDAYNKINYPADNLLYFDLHLWNQNITKKLIDFKDKPLGMKHGIGFSPGNFHNKIVNGKPADKKLHRDNNLLWLKNRVRPESFDFYKRLINENINNK